MSLDLVDRIRSFLIFLSAPDTFFASIGKHLRPQLHSPHDHILTEGDDAKAMYWLVRGAVAVTSRDGEATYVELKPGAVFGEIGILMDVPRTATIIARTNINPDMGPDMHGTTNRTFLHYVSIRCEGRDVKGV